MSLPDDLVDQAEQLARLDPTRPKQASLRRAISTASYGLFHLLAINASRLYVTESSMQARINRTYNHAEMRRVSTQFAASKLPRGIQPTQSTYTVSAHLQTVAQAFIDLQEARHKADYDLAVTFTRNETLGLVEQVRQAFVSWEEIKNTDEARLYLACFLLWKRWDEEPR